MVLTIPAVTACVVVVLAFFVGVTAIALSYGPGWRELRWFGIASLCAAIYAVCTLPTTLAVEPSTRAFFGRLGGTSATLLVASWCLYFATAHDRGVGRRERTFVTMLAAVAAAWMVPGLCRTSELVERPVAWLGVTYTSTRPTTLGMVTYALLLVVTVVIALRLFALWRGGRPGALGDLVGVSVQLVAGVNDALAASGVVDAPYALDVGQFAVVVAVGTTLVSRFVADARALERSAAELRAAQKELLRRERLAALGELSAVVAHEVRNPISVIFNAVSTLRKLRIPREAEALVEIVDEEAVRVERVVGELLEFARPREAALESVPVGPLVTGAVEAAVASFGGPGLVEVDVHAGLPDVAGDEQLLRQALVNLVVNALQSEERQSAVRVRTFAEGRPPAWVVVEVCDDGAGVPDEVAEKIFTPFFTTRARGTGLGLAIVKRIAEAHGGEVGWRPSDPHGATFFLRVPAMRASA